MSLRHLTAALIALAMAGTAPAAPSDTGEVSVAGSVAGLCVLGEPSRGSIDLGQMAATSGPRVGRIAALPPQDVKLPGSFCNFAGTAIKVEAEALVGDDVSAVQPGFARAVNFTSTVADWASEAPSVKTAANANGGSPAAEGSGGAHPAPKIADLTLTLSGFTVPADAILVAGLYSGRVTITLGPAIGGETPSGD